MATLSLRMRDDLKKKVQELAKEQGVSLNGFVNATLAAAVAQQETLALLKRVRAVCSICRVSTKSSTNVREIHVGEA